VKYIILVLYHNLNTILASPIKQLLVLTVIIEVVSIGYFLFGKKKYIITLCFISIVWTVGLVFIIGSFPLFYLPKIIKLGGYTFLAFGAILSYNRWYRPLKSNFWYWCISTIVIFLAMDTSGSCLYHHMITGQYSHSVVYYAIEVSEVEVEPSMENIRIFWMCVVCLVIGPTYFIVMFLGELVLDSFKRIKNFSLVIRDKFTTCFFYVIYICRSVTSKKKLKEIKNYMIDSFNLCFFYASLIIRLLIKIFKNLKK
jgi:hypothetical protein